MSIHYPSEERLAATRTVFGTVFLESASGAGGQGFLACGTSSGAISVFDLSRVVRQAAANASSSSSASDSGGGGGGAHRVSDPELIIRAHTVGRRCKLSASSTLA